MTNPPFTKLILLICFRGVTCAALRLGRRASKGFGKIKICPS